MRTSTIKKIHLILTSGCLLGGSLVAAESQATRPNIIVILTDDLGWADTTLYGHTKLYQTPNLERLSQRGMTFTRAYSVSPLCSPARASILTGLSPARTGIESQRLEIPAQGERHRRLRSRLRLLFVYEYEIPIVTPQEVKNIKDSI